MENSNKEIDPVRTRPTSNGMKRYISILVIFVFFTLIYMSLPSSKEQAVENSQQREAVQTPTLSFGDTHISLIGIQDSPEKRIEGLSGRPTLGESEGMLFIFPEEDIHSFWMKDMLFPIDIIWLSADLLVVHIEQNATPASYPNLFTPNAPALYVLEVPAGFTEKHNITIGSRAIRN